MGLQVKERRARGHRGAVWPVDMMFFGARAGVAKDLRQDNGAILSLGLGFGFLDIGAAVATKTSKVENTSYPRYFAITVGGGFSF